MLMTGKEYLESIRDGRVIYVGKERIEDQTTHPAFADGARTYAALFDLKADPALARHHVVRGERRALQHVLPATALAGGSAPPQPRAPKDRGVLPWPDGPHARRLRRQPHRALDEA